MNTRLALALASVIIFVPAARAAGRACELIRQSEAASILGAAVAPGIAVTGPTGDDLCRYAAPRRGMIAISLAETGGAEKYEKARAALKDAEAIAGLGDRAVFASRSKGTVEVLVQRGDRSLAIALSAPALNAPKASLIELARKALSGM